MPNFDSISEQLHRYKNEGLKVFVSSSFQTHSIPLLHIISRIDRDINIAFLQTGFHFPETIRYRDSVIKLLDLNCIDVRAAISPSQQLNDKGHLFYTSDPDYCCYLNKVAPMEPLLDQYDVWINGVRGDQNSNRSAFKIEQATHRRARRYHPMIDWTMKDIYAYINEYNLPRHPLDNKGYISIGCEPCTRKFSFDDVQEREGRWYGMGKTECGLHTDLIKKS